MCVFTPVESGPAGLRPMLSRQVGSELAFEPQAAGVLGLAGLPSRLYETLGDVLGCWQWF